MWFAAFSLKIVVPLLKSLSWVCFLISCCSFTSCSCVWLPSLVSPVPSPFTCYLLCIQLMCCWSISFSLQVSIKLFFWILLSWSVAVSLRLTSLFLNFFDFPYLLTFNRVVSSLFSLSACLLAHTHLLPVQAVTDILKSRCEKRKRNKNTAHVFTTNKAVLRILAPTRALMHVF